jgi:hypothetical protein
VALVDLILGGVVTAVAWRQKKVGRGAPRQLPRLLKLQYEAANNNEKGGATATCSCDAREKKKKNKEKKREIKTSRGGNGKNRAQPPSLGA